MAWHILMKTIKKVDGGGGSSHTCVLVYVTFFFLIFFIKVACLHFINLGPACYVVGCVSLDLAVLVQSGCRFHCLPCSSVLKLCTALTYSVEQRPPEKLTGFQLVKKFPTF
jgi:hypothetical protein